MRKPTKRSTSSTPTTTEKVLFGALAAVSTVVAVAAIVADVEVECEDVTVLGLPMLEKLGVRVTLFK